MEPIVSINEKADQLLLSRMQRGKSRTAQLIDRIVAITCAAVIFYVLSYLLTRENLVSVLLSVLLTAFFAGAARMIDNARVRHALARQRMQAAEALCGELLCIAPDDVFYHLMQSALSKLEVALFDDHRHVMIEGKRESVSFLRLPFDEKVQKRDLLFSTARDGVLVVTAPCDASIRNFAHKLGFSRVIDADALSIRKFYHPSRAEVSAYILEHMRPAQKSRAPLLQILFDSRRIKGYLFCSMFLLVSSLFTLYPTYYRISAIVSLALAAASYFAPRLPKKEHKTK